jgi:transcription elongation factor Elf1
MSITAHNCLDCDAALAADEAYEEGDEVTLTCTECGTRFQAVYENHALVVQGRKE